MSVLLLNDPTVFVFIEEVGLFSAVCNLHAHAYIKNKLFLHTEEAAAFQAMG